MRILALNGGGMRGYLELAMLQRLERRYEQSIASLFDLIAGVSTGAVIATALAAGMSVTETKQAYRQMGHRVFGQKAPWWVWPWCPWYRIEDVEATIQEMVGARHMGDALVDYMVYAVDMSTRLDTRFWKSWTDRDQEVPMYQPATASSAAPLYFRPYKIGSTYYADGGLAANNPAMCALAEAVCRGQALEDVRVVSLWSQHPKGFAEPQDALAGILNVAQAVPMVAIQAGADIVDYQVSQLLKERYVAVIPEIDFGIDTLDFESMDRVAEATYADSEAALMRVIA